MLFLFLVLCYVYARPLLFLEVPGHGVRIPGVCLFTLLIAFFSFLLSFSLSRIIQQFLRTNSQQLERNLIYERLRGPELLWLNIKFPGIKFSPAGFGLQVMYCAAGFPAGINSLR